MGRSQAVAKCALPFGAPHDPVDVVGAGVVLDQAGKKIPVVGIVHAQRFGIASVEIALLHFFDSGKSVRNTSSSQQMTFMPRFFAAGSTSAKMSRLP